LGKKQTTQEVEPSEIGDIRRIYEQRWANHGLFRPSLVAGGGVRATEDGLSYLADTILLLRYVELDGELSKTIGVLKKRTTDFEKTFRAYKMTANGVQVGAPIRGWFHGATDQCESSAQESPALDSGRT
jgi:hypothetical protein